MVKMGRPTKEELIEFSREHLYYEIWMFRGICKILAIGVSDTYVRNALLESFLMHARIIMDFLDNKKHKDDDAIANDYLSDSIDLKSILPPKSELLKDIHLRGHKELLHLSYKRLEVESEAKRWEFLQIMNEVMQRIELFINNADRRLIHDRLWGLVKNL